MEKSNIRQTPGRWLAAPWASGFSLAPQQPRLPRRPAPRPEGCRSQCQTWSSIRTFDQKCSKNFSEVSETFSKGGGVGRSCRRNFLPENSDLRDYRNRSRRSASGSGSAPEEADDQDPLCPAIRSTTSDPNFLRGRRDQGRQNERRADRRWRRLDFSNFFSDWGPLELKRDRFWRAHKSSTTCVGDFLRPAQPIFSLFDFSNFVSFCFFDLFLRTLLWIGSSDELLLLVELIYRY